MFKLDELSRFQNGTFAEVILRHAVLSPGAVAFASGETEITFKEFNEKVNRIIDALHLMGFHKGDVIGILSWNCLDYTCVLGAAMKGGFIASPYNPRLKASEIEYLISYSQAKILFFGPEMVDAARHLKAMHKDLKIISFENSFTDFSFIRDIVDGSTSDEPKSVVCEEDPVLIVYTSGTTGLPKGALYTHNRLMTNARVFLSAIPTGKKDTNLLALQLFHIAAVEAFLVFLYVGGTSIIVKSFDARSVMQTIQDKRPTVISLVPTALAAILSLPDLEKFDHSSLVRLAYMGSSMPVSLLTKAIDVFGMILYQYYGQTESGPLVSFLPAEAHTVVHGSPEDQKILKSCGHPPLGVQVRIVDTTGKDVRMGQTGEIIVRSKEIMKEYWQKPEETGKTIVDGWLHTRDLGYFDNNGYIYIADRQQDMIITGGEHVFPREVEEVLYQHPLVSEAAVIGVPDEYWVERIHAIVVLKHGSSLAPEEIIEFCKQRLARFKAPKSCVFVDSLPKSATGKILKNELRKSYKE
jgi:long-chain acyl-CoA synthetase